MKIQTNTKHHHRIVPVALITLGTPITLVVGFLLVANLLFHDEKPPDDSALLLPDVTVADADNAYADVQKISADFTSADPNAQQPYEDKAVDQMLSGGAWDDAHATEVITKYSAAINDFHAAAKKPQYQDPYAAHPGTVTFENLFANNIGTTRLTAKIVALESLRKMRNGDVAGGLAEATEIIKLAHMLESGQPSNIGWLVGSATKQVGLSVVRQIALQTPITTEQANSIIQEIDKYQGTTSSAAAIAKLEYLLYKNYLPQRQHFDTMYKLYNTTTDVTTGKEITPPSGTMAMVTVLDRLGIFKFYYWPNQNWRFEIERETRMVDAFQADCVTGNFNPPRQTFSKRNGFGRLLEPNAIGKYLADMGEISMGGVATKRCNETLAMSATQAILAISAYQKDNQKLPITLDELVPNYLTSVPTDPYSGKAIIYVPEKKAVYSVGSNRVDEGGNTAADSALYPNAENPWQTMLDPTFVVSR